MHPRYELDSFSAERGRWGRREGRGGGGGPFFPAKLSLQIVTRRSKFVRTCSVPIGYSRSYRLICTVFSQIQANASLLLKVVCQIFEPLFLVEPITSFSSHVGLLSRRITLSGTITPDVRATWFFADMNQVFDSPDSVTIDSPAQTAEHNTPSRLTFLMLTR